MDATQPLATTPNVKQALHLHADAVPGRGIGVLVINFNTATQTLRCLDSLQRSSLLPEWVLILDNASSQEDYQRLLQGARMPAAGSIYIYRAENNLGFAQGSNVLIDLLMQKPNCRYIMLLNNDAVGEHDMLESLSSALKESGEDAGLAGGRMHKLTEPTQVDTLGIAIYSSLMPADRKTLNDIYVGPTGGCCMLTRELLQCVYGVYGYYFDARFFCYCEDTDLVLRAVLLGYRPLYLDQVLALHEGQASTGGGYNSFIAYHGLRNTLWMHIKLIPAVSLWKHCVLLLLAHVLMVARHILAGNFKLIFRVYFDAFRKLPEFLAERKRIQPRIKCHQNSFQHYVTKRFYRRGYIGLILQQSGIFRTLFSKFYL